MSAQGIKHWTKVLDDALAGYPVSSIAVEYGLVAMRNLNQDVSKWAALMPVKRESA